MLFSIIKKKMRYFTKDVRTSKIFRMVLNNVASKRLESLTSNELKTVAICIIVTQF